jgi:hypothetical protein
VSERNNIIRITDLAATWTDVLKIYGNWLRSRGPDSIPGATRLSVWIISLERGPPSLVSTTVELLGSKSRGSGLEN